MTQDKTEPAGGASRLHAELEVTMDETELKLVKAREYGRGYEAGKRKKQRDILQEVRRKKESAFWQRAFLAAIPAAFSASGWKRGEEPIVKLEDRMRLAAEAADSALRHAITRL